MTRWRTLSINTSLRGLSIALKASMMLGLAAFLPTATIGEYGLLAAAVQLTTYIYGLELHYFAQREMRTDDLPLISTHLRTQFVAYVPMYVIGGAVLFPVLRRLGLPLDVLPESVALACLHHAGIELYRVLVRLQRPVQASTVLFFRDSAWVIPCFAMWIVSGNPTLSDVIWAWLVGAVTACVIALFYLSRLLPARTGSRSIDQDWLRRGLKVGLASLPASLSMRSILTLDRILLATFASKDVVGAYVFFAGLAGAVANLFESGILITFTSRLLERHRRGEFSSVLQAFADIRKVCLWIPSVLAVSGSVLAYLVVRGLQKDSFIDHVDFLPFVFGAQLFLAYSYGWNSWLYMSRADRQIAAINVFALGCMLFIAAIGVYLERTILVLFSVNVAALVLYLGKRAAGSRWHARFLQQHAHDGSGDSIRVADRGSY